MHAVIQVRRSSTSMPCHACSGSGCTLWRGNAGYTGAIVSNRTGVDGCETLISMLVEAGIPAIFVSRTDGFRILGASLDGYTCSEDGSGTLAPAAGTIGSTVDVKATFDGWGYIHLFDTKTFEDIDQFAIPEAHDPAYAEGFGDLSVHEVATDPDVDRVYVSYPPAASECWATASRAA